MLRTRLATAAVLAALTLAPLNAALAGDRSADPYGGYFGPNPWGFMPPMPVPGPGFMGHLGTPCAGSGVSWMVHSATYAASFMDLDAGQQKALAALEDGARTATGQLREACRDTADWRGTAPERIKRMEDGLTAAREAVRDIRPLFLAFYDTLSVRQKEVLDDLVSGRRALPWGWWQDE